MSITERIKVVGRMGVKCELNSKITATATDRGNRIVLKNTSQDYFAKSFTFDAVYRSNVKQAAIYEKAAYGIVDAVLQGYNGTVISYGPRGCGKSFTMFGNQQKEQAKGIVPRALKHIFDTVESEKDRKFRISCSVIAILKEQTRDLFVGKQTERSKCKNKGFNERLVTSIEEALKLVNSGLQSYSEDSEDLEEMKAHLLFTIVVESELVGTDSREFRVGRLNLVDLSNIELQSGEAKEETVNSPLKALESVVSALTNNANRGRVPYEASPLTSLLKESIGGNAKTVFIVNVAPSDSNYRETVHALSFAEKVRLIENKPRLNKNLKDSTIRDQMRHLKQIELTISDHMESQEYEQEFETYEPFVKDSNTLPVKRIKPQIEDKKRLEKLEKQLSFYRQIVHKIFTNQEIAALRQRSTWRQQSHEFDFGMKNLREKRQFLPSIRKIESQIFTEIHHQIKQSQMPSIKKISQIGNNPEQTTAKKDALKRTTEGGFFKQHNRTLTKGKQPEKQTERVFNDKGLIKQAKQSRIFESQVKPPYGKKSYQQETQKSQVPKHVSRSKPNKQVILPTLQVIPTTHQNGEEKMDPLKALSIHNLEAFTYILRPRAEHTEMIKLFLELRQINQPFIDSANPKTHSGQYTHSKDIFGSEFALFQQSGSVMLRQVHRQGLGQKLEPKDVIQGELGDCYFLSSVAALVDYYPERVAELFVFDTNPVGFYVVRLFNDGEWCEVVLDDRFPCIYQRPIFAHPHDNELWVMLLEKAWAKLNGGYQHIEGGSASEAFSALTGATCSRIEKGDQIQRILSQSSQFGGMVTCTSTELLKNLTKEEAERIGLIQDHIYSVQKLVEIDSNEQKELIVKVRNPWGSEEWKGDWSFNSFKWTQDLRQRYNNIRDAGDGSFYMPWKEFERYLGNATVCNIVPNFVSNSFRSKNARLKSNYIRMSIAAKGVYTISIYQESKRKHKDTPDYELSESRLIILRMDQLGDFKFVKSGTSKSDNLHVEAGLSEGEYMLSCMVNWRYFQQHECIVSSYGPEPVVFATQEEQSISARLKDQMIRSYAQQFPGVKSPLEKIPEAWIELVLDKKAGIGYFKVCNPSKKLFKITIEYGSSCGIYIMSPTQLPNNMTMAAESESFVGLYVSAAVFERGFDIDCSEVY